MIVLTVPFTLRSSAIIVGAVVIGAYVILGGPSDVWKRKKRKDNVPGLANIGNSCFLNALVQSLASCPLFVTWLGSKHQDPSQPLVSTLHKLLQVLNNGGDHKGDACAGEVMCALREHGWVISSEEQDAHELFHAVTATIDEELINAASFPSLLDVSWIEADSADISQIGDDGVLFKSDCWKQSKAYNLDELNITENYELAEFTSRTERQSVGVDKNSKKCEGNNSSEVAVGNGHECRAVESSVKRTEVHEATPVYNCKCKSGGCDDNGCESSIKSITNGHASGGMSSPIETCETNGKSNGLTELRCDIYSTGDSAIITDQNGEVENDGETEKCTNGNTIKNIANFRVHVSSPEEEANVNSHADASSQEEEANVNSHVDASSPEEEANVNSHADASSQEDLCFVKKDETKGKLFSRVAVPKSRQDLKLESNFSAVKVHTKHHDYSPFQGHLASQLQCTLCGYKNPAQWTSFESLSLSLPSLPWGEVTLQELLDSYITQEKVTDVTCDSCTKRAGVNVKTSFTKQLTIGKLPNCLCFHIKRTVWMENGSAVKRQDHVIFPEFLTMDPYTYVTSVNNQGLQSGLLGGRECSIPPLTSVDSIGSLAPCPPSSIMSRNANATEIEASPFFRVTRVQCEQLYRLKAVIVHVGDVFCGHFVTYRRGALGARTRNRWYYTSDLTVRETNLEEVRKANAYMILYEKVSE